MPVANRIVARFRDGRRIKGSTADFLPTRESLHVHTPEGEVVNVKHADLKALFFVRDLDGDPERNDRQEFAADRTVQGRKIRVEFLDGEVLLGVTLGYQPNRPGFFIVPADQESNIERCFVVSSAVRDVQLL